MHSVFESIELKLEAKSVGCGIGLPGPMEVPGQPWLPAGEDNELRRSSCGHMRSGMGSYRLR